MTAWLLPLAVGFATGILSAWGVGGGTLLLLCMTLLLGVDQRTAQTINLLYFLPTAGMGLLSHGKSGLLEKAGASQRHPRRTDSGGVGGMAVLLRGYRAAAPPLRRLSAGGGHLYPSAKAHQAVTGDPLPRQKTGSASGTACLFFGFLCSRQASMPRLVRYFFTISATLKVMASSNSRRSRPVSFLIFSSRYTSVFRWTNSFRAVSETFRLFSKNL